MIDDFYRLHTVAFTIILIQTYIFVDTLDVAVTITLMVWVHLLQASSHHHFISSHTNHSKMLSRAAQTTRLLRPILQQKSRRLVLLSQLQMSTSQPPTNLVQRPPFVSTAIMNEY